jgi:hypothetical protein
VTSADLRLALRVVAGIIEEGEKSHPKDAWLELPIKSHLARSAVHIEKALLGVRSDEDDLANGILRGLMGLELRERQKEQALGGRLAK